MVLSAGQEHLAAAHENGMHSFGCPEGCPDDPGTDTDHEAFYFEGEPVRDDACDHSGLFCYCGREVVNVVDTEGFELYPTGWAHVGCE